MTVQPLAPSRPWRYSDELVDVVCLDGAGTAERVHGSTLPSRSRRRGVIVDTAHFRLRRNGRRIELGHRLGPGELDNDLAGLLAAELFEPGWCSGSAVFERLFTGVVRSCVPGSTRAWLTFYDNTVARIRAEMAGEAEMGESADSGGAPARAGHSCIADIAPVYARALRLVPPGPVLDLGSCFGFFAMLVAERDDNTVTASDVCAGTTSLLASMAAERLLPLCTLTCDAARVPLPDRSVRTVTAIHLLEHLDPAHGDAVLAEALRLATGTVVVAVPFEREPDPTYGHVRSFDRAALADLGRRSGHRYTVDEHHGGWLVLDADPSPIAGD